MERPSDMAFAYAAGFLRDKGVAGNRVSGQLAREGRINVDWGDLYPNWHAPSVTDRLWAAEVLRKRAEERPDASEMFTSVATWLETPNLERAP